MKIVSFLPSSTEMVYSLGLGDQLVGVTHECDYPDAVKKKSVVVQSAFDRRGLSPKQIDEVVSRTLKTGQSLYVVDEALLREMAPDLILTQDLCQVCAPSGNEVGRVIKLLPKRPRIVWLSPHSVSDIFKNLKEVGEVTGKEREANRLVNGLQRRMKSIQDRIRAVKNRPRVFCMEWLSPPFNAGHWMPELVEIAGGIDELGEKGRDSKRVSWEQILDYAPEVLILCPCGYDTTGTLKQVHHLTRYPDWDQLPAVKTGKVYAVDANSYFARPGPRIVDGLEILAALIHPEKISWKGSRQAYRPLRFQDIKKLSEDRSERNS